ncbi:MAG: AzlD domain-containing protein [Hyphomicrobiaceae bacterium]|nr:AzlD domain-containing protein [Hyphomicrobiaceae bacterium]
MTDADKATVIIAVMALAAAFCRFSGFWLMRFVPITPRVQAGLSAIPVAVMAGIMVPAVVRGGIPETAGLVATVATAKLAGNDLLAILAGLACVALLRQVV